MIFRRIWRSPLRALTRTPHVGDTPRAANDEQNPLVAY
jgi:hypothetical protein